MNLKSPFFSIILPVYNVSKYLDESINCVINQTFKDFEVIIINDGSTDNSLELFTSYAKKNENIILIDQKNEGVCSARNAGFKLSKGKYVWFIDPDDFIELNSLEVIYNNLIKEDVDLLGISSFSFKENNVAELKKNSYYPPTPTLSNREFVDNGYSFLIAPWLYIINADFLRSSNISWRHDIKIHTDWIFLLTVFSKLKTIKCIDKYLYNYRIRKDGLVRAPNRDLDRIYSASELIYFLKEQKNDKILNVFWDNQMIDSLMKYYIRYFELTKNNQNNLLKEDFYKIREIKLKTYKKDSLRKNTLKIFHNNFFFIYKILVVQDLLNINHVNN